MLHFLKILAEIVPYSVWIWSFGDILLSNVWNVWQQKIRVTEKLLLRAQIFTLLNQSEHFFKRTLYFITWQMAPKISARWNSSWLQHFLSEKS